MATFKEIQSYVSTLESAYGRGLLTVTLDGVTTTYDNEAGLKSRLDYFKNELKKATTGASKRPRAAGVDMSGFR